MLNSGLTRRGESSPRKPAANKAAVSRGPSRGTQDEGDAGEEAARKALADSRAKERARRNQITDPGLTQSQAAAQRTAEVKRDSAKTGSQRLAEKADRAGNIYARGQTPRQSDTEKQAAARKKLGTVPPRPPRGFWKDGVIMARYERSIYTDPDPKESRRSEEKEERRRADERSLAPYERKAAEMEKRGKSRGRGRWWWWRYESN
jgi:hypothetical protein